MAEVTLVQMRYFCRVAETGSFAAAAAAEHVSATAVAAAVTSLERNLGAQLCVRERSRGVRLTTTGEVLRTEAAKVLDMAEELRLRVIGGPDELVGPLVVGCYSTFAPTVLPGLFEEFARRHPRVMLNFSVQPQEKLLGALRSGSLDCALMYDIGLPDGLTKKALYHAPIHVIISGDHPLADRPSISLHELKDEPLILFDSTPAGPHTLRVLEQVGFSPNVRHRVPNYELVRSMVARNLGYSLMIHHNPAKFSYEGRPIAEVPIAPALPIERMVAVWTADVPLNARAKELVAVAGELLGANRH